MDLVFRFAFLGQNDGVLKQEHSAMVLVELHQNEVTLSQYLPMLPHVTLTGGEGGGGGYFNKYSGQNK